MIIREVRPEESQAFNAVATHPMQTWEWGEFREETGVEVVRLGVYEDTKIIKQFQITFHDVPMLPFKIGYCPKSAVPEEEAFAAIAQVAKKYNAIFVKFEPSVFVPIANSEETPETQETPPELKKVQDYMFSKGCVFGKPLFTKYSFVLDLTKSEQIMVGMMKQKTRYNVGLAQRKGVTVRVDDSPEGLEEYLRLTFEETTKRQKFYAHDKEYHRKMWKNMHKSGIAHLLRAEYQGETLATWVVFILNGVLYYPYGASSSKHRKVMASNLMMWEAIKFGQKMGCTSFDMWGSLGPNPDKNHSWIGFHRFKEGYGPILVESAGTFDYVINQPMYKVYEIADKLRWGLLRLRAMLPV